VIVYRLVEASSDAGRLLICGEGDLGQTAYILPAILHRVKDLPLYELNGRMTSAQIVDVRPRFAFTQSFISPDMVAHKIRTKMC